MISKTIRMTTMKRKSLSEQDIEAARRLKEIWNSRKDSLGLTQERAAEMMGFTTQGAVSHYLNAQTPLNLEAVLKFSGLLQVSPETIRPDMAGLISIARKYTPEPDREYHDGSNLQEESEENTHSGVMTASAYRVKKLMDLTGWSPSVLAQKIGVSQQTVHLWVDGKSIPSPANLDKLTEITGYPSYWFMLPPEETDQISTSEIMKIGPSQRALLRVFNAFPEEEQGKILKEMTEKKESMEDLVARWLKAQKHNLL